MYTNATIGQLEDALATINEKYDGNISFRDIATVSSKRNKFTLKAVSGKAGSRIGHTGRKLPCASWHVHGEFFDALFEIDPNIYVLSMGKKITKDHGNWEDRNIGSMMQPMYFSEASIF